MRKVFHFDSPRERYRCDAVIVWCFDNRFELGFRKFLGKIGVSYSDPVKVAGGAKTLSSPAREADREFVLEQIRTSMQLHGTTRAILMLHSDCGAYGGLEAFGGDTSAEAEHHRLELHRAVHALKEAIPGLNVSGYFADFDGIWEAIAGDSSSA
jgi:carbonic anhydrase-like protein